MVASDVYTIAKALPKEELIKLSNMLRTYVTKSDLKLQRKNPALDYTKEDGLRYLLENYIKKPKKYNRTIRTKK